MPEVLDGKVFAARVRARLAQEAARDLESRALARPPALAAVLVGDDPASEVYVRGKVKACREAGFASREVRLCASTSEAELRRAVEKVGADDAVDGVLVQLPLPASHAAHRILESIPVAKDVDGFHPMNVGRAATGTGGFLPCTPKGILALLAEHRIDVRGAEVVVVGASNIVGRPMAHLLAVLGATVTVCQKETRDLAAHTRRAEILIVAAGVPGLVRPGMTRDGAVLVDVGVNRVGGGIIGDIDPACWPASRAYTPVPGGIGPMTVAMLLSNTLDAARARRG